MTKVVGHHQKNARDLKGATELAARTGEVPTLHAEIQAVMDSTRQAERALRAEFGEADHPDLARRLGELKRVSRMRILHIQLKYAKAEGRTRLERRIRNTIEALQRPATPGGPRHPGGISPPSGAKPVVAPAGGSQP